MWDVRKDLKIMKGEEFIEKVLAGERDFSKIKLMHINNFGGRKTLESGFILCKHEGFRELQTYLKKQNLKENPLIINDSDFSYVRARRLYLPYVRGRNVDFSSAYFISANFSYGNFLGADFHGINLTNADLRKANLNDINGEHANFNNTNLTCVDCKSAKLISAVFRNANLKNAKLWRSNFEYSTLSNANLQGADLSGANFDCQYSYLMGPDSSNLKGANLTNTNLTEVNFTRANLENVCIRGAKLQRTNLTLACLRGVKFIGVVNLDGVIGLSTIWGNEGIDKIFERRKEEKREEQRLYDSWKGKDNERRFKEAIVHLYDGIRTKACC